MVEPPKGFIAALYDLSFHTFITPKIIQIIYVIWLIGIALWALTFLIAGFAMQRSFYGEQSPNVLTILVHVVGAAVIFIVGSISARMTLEFVIAVFRIAENTDSLRRDTTVT